MQLFCFDPAVGSTITRYGSAFVLSPIVRIDHAAHVSCMHVGPNGIVGYHQATVPQLFLVVTGSGWVTGTDCIQHAITAGHAAWWERDEWHESGSDRGMTVIVIEAEGLDPAMWMLKA